VLKAGTLSVVPPVVSRTPTALPKCSPLVTPRVPAFTPSRSLVPSPACTLAAFERPSSAPPPLYLAPSPLAPPPARVQLRMDREGMALDKVLSQVGEIAVQALAAAAAAAGSRSGTPSSPSAVIRRLRGGSPMAAGAAAGGGGAAGLSGAAGLLAGALGSGGGGGAGRSAVDLVASGRLGGVDGAPAPLAATDPYALVPFSPPPVVEGSVVVPSTEVPLAPWQTLALACVDVCAACGSCGDVDKLRFCTDCGEAYHSYCAGPSDEAGSTAAVGPWRCLACASCEACDNNPKNSGKPLVACHGCGASMHAVCLKPSLSRADLRMPLYCFRCVDCRTCVEKLPKHAWSHSHYACYTCCNRDRCVEALRGGGEGPLRTRVPAVVCVTHLLFGCGVAMHAVSCRG
jgi:hypothetical protein